MSTLQTFTTRDRPDLHDQFDDAFHGLWPELILHDPVSNELVARVATTFPDFDVTVVDHGAVAAQGWGVTLGWDRTLEDLPGGYNEALIRSFADLGRVHDTLSVMAIAVNSQFQGRGVAAHLLNELRRRAHARGLSAMIAPVRPTLKTRYPLTTMTQYAQWRRKDGTHFDPWIRVHERLGATILAPADQSMIVSGTRAQFQEWTQMSFPASGAYVVPGALDLVMIDHDNDTGIYIEPNLWMRHY